MKTQLNKWMGKVTMLFFLFASYISNISAQSDTISKKWNFLADVYLMFPYMNGDIGLGNQFTVPIDANPGDIFSKLKMAGMLYFEAKTDKWAITSDFVYMRLNQEVTPSKLLESGDVTAKELIWETAGLYRLLPFWEVGIGGRLDNIATEIDVRRFVAGIGNPTELVNESASKTWFDPILITRFTGDINDKWLFQFRGDVGGFGVGSDLTWQLQAYAGYRFTKVFQITAGYRILSIDYDKGSGTERFIYNVNTSGPELKFGFNF
jgi:hypothetical protein